jgi:hypothetical protein
MVDEKTRKQQTLVIAIVAMIAVAGLGYSLYTHSAYYANASTSTVSQLKSNNSGSTASAFQALYVNDTDGQSYWVYAPSQYQAMSILGYETGASTPNAASVSNVQSSIFFTPTLADSSGVKKWVFTCLVTISIIDMSTDKILGNLATNEQIAYTSSSLISGQLTEVISASSSGASLNALLAQTVGSTTGTYAYTEYLTEIGLTINFQDGTTSILTAPSTMQNVLTWGIQLTSVS